MDKYWYQTSSPDRYGLLKEFAKVNKMRSTDAEMLLWRSLSRKETGKKWRRQHIIGDYIVDFVCMSENLIVEVDGAYHAELEQMDYDTMRTGWLEGKGFRVVRFTNEEVLSNVDKVVERIQNIIRRNNE